MKRELKRLLAEMQEREFHVDEMAEVLNALVVDYCLEDLITLKNEVEEYEERG